MIKCDPEWGTKEDDAKAIAALPELVEVARKVATHFEDTDAPLGIEARAALHKAGLLSPKTDRS